VCSVWISEQTAIISLYNINWLVFITETECVYCAVRTGSLNAIRVNLGLFGRAVFQAVRRRSLTAEARVWSEIRPCEIYVWQSSAKTWWSSQYFGCPVPPLLDTLLHPHVVRTRKTNCSSLGTFQNISACSGIWDHWIEKYLRVVILRILHARINFKAFHLPFAGYQYLSGRLCDWRSGRRFFPFSCVFKQDVKPKFLPLASHAALVIHIHPN